MSPLAAPAAGGARAAPRAELLGCPLDAVGFEEAAAEAVRWCRGERRPHTLVTVNAALLVMARDDAALARACRSADLAVADGVPVVWASRLAGRPLPGRVAGVDLMARLLDLASEHRLRVWFLGAREEVVRALVARCATRWPGAVVAGFRDGYFGAAEEPEIVRSIRESGADMLFVGMPSPFKEVFCERRREALGVPLVMGVGGSFDVLAGFVRRAPRFMQALGLEWLWRLAMEPRRLWRRYLVTNTLFVGRVAREALRRRAPGTAPGAT